MARKGSVTPQAVRDKISASMSIIMKRKYAEGKRKACPQNLAEFNRAMKAGEVRNPKCNPERDIEILKLFNKLGAAYAADFFNLTKGAIYCAVWRAKDD